MANLKDIILIKNGKIATKTTEGLFPIFGGNGIIGYSNQYNYEDIVVIGRVGAKCGSVHRGIGKCWVSDNALAGVPINGCNDFNYYLLKCLELNKRQIGSSQPLLTQTILYSINLNFPKDKTTQQKIASVLSTLDDKIELNNKINTELESMAKTLYDYWFVQFDFPNADGKPYKSSGGEMEYNEVLKREIPKGWEVKSLGDIEGNIVTGKTPATAVSENFGCDVPFICIGDVRGNMHIINTVTKLSQKGADSQVKKYIPKGAICVTCIASPGLVGFATENSQTNQQLNSIVCQTVENRYFLYFYLKDYFKFSSAKTGNTFANMNKEDFSSIEVIKPTKTELIKFFDSIDSSINRILVNSKQNQELASLRDWLLPMLMNGQVTVAGAYKEVEEKLAMVAEEEAEYKTKTNEL